MAKFWSKVKEICYSDEPRHQSERKSPRMANLALEVLANREEAQDEVYYDALKRINAKNKDTHLLKKTRKRGVGVQTFNTGLGNRENANNEETAARERSSREGHHEQKPYKLQRLHFTFIGVLHTYVHESHIWRSIRKVFCSATSVVLDPEERLYFTWMGVVTGAVLYNYYCIIMRIAFQEMRTQVVFQSTFWFLDFLCDVLYLCDIGVQCRTSYRDNHGIMVEDTAMLFARYRKQLQFKLDLVSALPLDAIYGWMSGNKNTMYSLMLRFLRLLKLQCVFHFFFLSDYRTSKPNRLRAAKLSFYLALAMHWVACLYYMISEYEGLGSNGWVYPQEGQESHDFQRKYIRSLYWSVLTLTTIGETPTPHTNLEYLFTGSMFLLGIFVFAAVVGNVGDIISNINAARTDFQARMDLIKHYMEHYNVPESQQNKVKRWAFFAWTRTQALDEALSLNMLPQRLRAEIAIHVHLETLKKVKLFKDCEEGLLCELVLKLRPQVFSPGDYICRMGEIGREMYIISHGKVEVAIPDARTGEKVVVACLSEGNYFGEISLLRLDRGRNRRSADVHSVGYSELLCLSQKDLMETLEEYPEAKRGLECQGRDRLQRTKTEVGLRTRHPSNGVREEEEIAFSFAREMQEMKKILEIIHETQEKFSNDQMIRLEAKCSELTSEIEYLKRELQQSHKRIEEMKERQLVCQVPGSTHGLAKSQADELLQRIIHAAAQASQKLNIKRQFSEAPSSYYKATRQDSTSHAQNRLRKWNSKSVPRIPIENNLNGVKCSFSSAPVPSQRDCNKQVLE